MTILFYNWSKIFKVSEKNSREICRILKMMSKREIPKNNLDPIYKYYNLDLTGKSFLMHDDVLVFNAYKHTQRDVAIYFALASCRSFADYMVDRTLSLELSRSPVDPRLYLYDQEIIRVEDGLIHFIYEETPPLSDQH